MNRLIDLDSANIKAPTTNQDVPSLPEPDIKVLKTHLKQVRIKALTIVALS